MSFDSPKGTADFRSSERFAILAARFNQKHVDHLLDNMLKAFHTAGVTSEEIETIRVPGSNEIPYAASMLACTGQYDCIIALGVIVAGETRHHEIIAQNTSQALQLISIDTGIPVLNGILVARTQEQADARCMGEINRGEEFAHAALEMADLKVRLSKRLEELEFFEEDESLEFFPGSEKEDLEWDSYLEDDPESWKL